ncbi:MAG: hypothetical protein P4M09_27495 [Devosia sp.]|nr:hypothetical protein [Devosia sp.]
MNVRAETAQQRHAMHAALDQRNRFVSILRIGLPVVGAVVVLAFFLQILLASLANSFGIGRISFSGDTVIVDTPSYSGVMSNGDVYKLSAEGAATAITNLNLIDIKNATLVLTKPDGSQMKARAQTSSFETLGQVLTVPDTALVSDSDGNSGTLRQVVVDVSAQTLKASGPVSLLLKDGSTVDGSGLTYSAKTGIWDFGKATVTVPDTDDAATPGEAGP